ncbi:tetratricopeptide repeat protein [Jeotgalicoccus nanhaiensis]|uniref:Tetratricopeptide repeat protein n=1 Tax=Jeotgalicoccus nanhaiensis TaxID=568603 RepID=A0ABR9XX09_9STAP|nr:tetratricopeptide repeat protein [Jeotgalicoccus nanhaiensis]MBF0753378.1 tetratricopeptide repeat protein [Jeotgalicoccus nanhaiensis]TFU62541.1 tetratricopeptide repeat protein [Jeotgalicoccus nanhaiensis]
MQEEILRIIDKLRQGTYPEEDLNYILNSLEQFHSDESLEALFLLGDALQNAGLDYQARQVFLHLNDNVDHDDYVISYLVDSYINEARLDEALTLINNSPETPTVLMLKSEIFQQMNLNDVAVRLLFEAKTMTDDIIIDFAIAELYYTLGDLEEAIRFYETVLNEGLEEVNGIIISLRLADINLNLLNFDDARAYFDNVPDESYGNEDFYKEALLEYNLKEYDRAKTLLDKVIDNEPYFINAYILLMNIYETEHNLDEALETLLRYLRENDKNALIYFHIGRLYFRQNKPEEAIENFSLATSLDEDYDDAYLMLFESILKTGETETVDEYVKHLDINALSGESIYLLAKIEAENENDEKALKYYEDAEALIGESAEFYADFYYYLIEINHPKKKEVLEKLIKLEPDNLEWQLDYERIAGEEDEF